MIDCRISVKSVLFSVRQVRGTECFSAVVRTKLGWGVHDAKRRLGRAVNCTKALARPQVQSGSFRLGPLTAGWVESCHPISPRSVRRRYPEQARDCYDQQPESNFDANADLKVLTREFGIGPERGSKAPAVQRR